MSRFVSLFLFQCQRKCQTKVNIALNLSKFGVFSGPYFSVYGLNTMIYSLNYPYSVRIRKNTDQNILEFGLFSRSENIKNSHPSVHNSFLSSGVNPLSANPTKWSNTLKQFVGFLPTNCLSVFDHFVGLALKGLIANFNIASLAIAIFNKQKQSPGCVL